MDSFSLNNALNWVNQLALGIFWKHFGGQQYVAGTISLWGYAMLLAEISNVFWTAFDEKYILQNFILSDLKAFERRLTEVISCVHPSTVRWRGKCANNTFAIRSMNDNYLQTHLFHSLAGYHVNYHISRCLVLAHRSKNCSRTTSRIADKSFCVCHCSVNFV